MFLLLNCSIYSFKPDITVSKDGSGDFSKIQDAINSIDDNNNNYAIIYIKNGVYNEQLFIEKNNIAFIGENRDSVLIIYAVLRKNWRENHESDYGASVVNIKNNVSDLFFHNLTIYNNYGTLFGDNDHQFAIRGGEGVTRIIITDCNIKADGGDTVSLWNTKDGMYYHKNCYFEGYVDYVCPRGFCYIEDSKFYGRNLTASIWHDGSGNEDHKFVIKNSYFDGVKNFPLGRFHRDAQFFIIDCIFSNNMADKKIFFAPSNPPRTLQWGEERIYFYNANGENKNYEWHKNNLEKYDSNLKPEDITAEWTFNYLWNPEEIIKIILNR